MMMLLALAVVPYVEAAQSGTVRGTVADESELGIPGATVILRGPLIGGELTTTTDEEGNFRFVNVPVGTHDLEVLKTGFPGARRKVRVRLDEASFVPVELKVGGEVVVIEDTLPPIDTSRSSVSTELGKDAMDQLPVGRSYQDVVNLLPGVSGRVDTASGGPGDGNPSVRGEGQYGNNYLLDGISTRDPATKTFGANVNFDAIEDIRVYTDGAPAEFGQSTGMTVNVVTRDGGDEHFGSAAYYLNTAAGSGTYLILDQELGEEVEKEKRQFTAHSLSLLAGGPIVKEKVWYLASVDLGTDTTTYEGQDPDAPYQAYDGGGFAKLTWFATPDVKLRYQINGSISAIDNSITSSLVLPEAQERYESRDLGNQFEVVWRPAPLTELDLKVIHHLSEIDVTPQSGDPDTAQVVDENGRYTGNASAYDYNDRSRTGFAFTLTQLADKALGEHRIKAGLEGWELSETRELDYTGPRDGLLGDAAEGYPCTAPDYLDCYARQEFVYVGPLTHRGVLFGLFLQDDWRPIETLTINAGVRLDHEALYTSEGVQVVENWMPAPRLGIAWDATGDHKTRVSLNAGQYYDVSGNGFAEWGDSRTSAGYSYYYGPYSQTEPYFTQGGGSLIYCTEASLSQLEGDERSAAKEACFGDLKPYHLDKIVLGVDRELLPSFVVGVRGILSQTVDLPEDVNADDSTWVITNPPEKRRDYWALEVTAEKAFDKHWQVLASYTLSESRGTHPGQSEGSSGSGFGSNGNEVGVWGDDIGNPETRAELFDAGYGEYVAGYHGLGSTSDTAGYYGYLPYHSLHSVKVSGSYTLDTGRFHHTVGAVYELDSGHAWEKYGWVPNYLDYSAMPEGRGTRFMPVTHYFDVHFGEEFAIDDQRSVELTVDVFNLLDLEEAVTAYANDDANFGLTMYRQEPRSVRASVKVTY